jgi:hypothetical protein
MVGSKANPPYRLDGDDRRFIKGSAETFDANMNAIERLLGVSSPFLARIEEAAIREGLAINQQIAAGK